MKTMKRRLRDAAKPAVGDVISTAVQNQAQFTAVLLHKLENPWH
jgi:hypothetical protein